VGAAVEQAGTPTVEAAAMAAVMAVVEAGQAVAGVEAPAAVVRLSLTAI